MIITGLGTDIIEIFRIEKLVSKGSEFTEKIFNKSETEYFKIKKNACQTIAGYFCAKEAVAKALGTGFSGLSPKDIVISNDDFGKPTATVKTHPDTLFMLSISHCKEYAAATAIAYKCE